MRGGPDDVSCMNALRSCFAQIRNLEMTLEPVDLMLTLSADQHRLNRMHANRLGPLAGLIFLPLFSSRTVQLVGKYEG